MDKYLIRKSRTQDSSPMQDSSLVQDSFPVQDSSSFSKWICVNFNLENLPSDLGLREKISSYHPNTHVETWNKKILFTKRPLSTYSPKPWLPFDRFF